MKENKRRVVVTGMGAVTPLGLTSEEFWMNLLAGVSGAAEITRFDHSRLDTHFACELKNFDPLNYIDRKAARRLDPFAQYALASTKEAIADSNINIESMSEEQKDKTGVIFGSGMGGIKTFYDQSVVNHTEGPGKITPFFIPMIIP
ncbi:MAG: beta-ketoacyl synthase N-terminal-like domain-containing protein, partial [Nitrososphaeraceae archaeon]|nr:beta-ketoacyl synthase N-terminal-like domain-containing protein [Nitrososphaeraceae archaeon]